MKNYQSVPLATKQLGLQNTSLTALSKSAPMNTNLKKLMQASQAAPLLYENGFDIFSAAKRFAAWSHSGRLRNHVAFAPLAGVTHYCREYTQCNYTASK